MFPPYSEPHARRGAARPTRGLLLLFCVLSAPAVAVTLGSGCNPIFGIVSRQEGPTWCEEDAQAAPSGYCDDFDRPGTNSQEIPAVVGGTRQVSDAAASSPPNSLEIKLDAVPKGTTAASVVGNLVQFGPTGLGAAPIFTCQVDVRPSDIESLLKAGTPVGLIGVGGQATFGSKNPRPELVFLVFGPNGVEMQLLELPATNKSKPMGDPCRIAKGFQPLAAAEWETFSLEFRALDTIDAGGFTDSGLAPCLVGGDGGRAEVDGAPPKGYLVLARLGAFVQDPVVVPDLGFVDAFFAYGLTVQAESPALTVYMDNARCQLAASF